MASGGIRTEETLFDFFHHEVDHAVSLTGHRVSEEGVYYLSNLLVEKGRGGNPDVPDTLAELALQAQIAEDRGQAVRRWRALGDKALYTCGFFPDSLQRGPVGEDYYTRMGATAYDTLSKVLSPARRTPEDGAGGHKGLDAIFAELAQTFEACVDVLREVRDAARGAAAELSDQELIKLYDEWLTTGSPRALRLLQRAGVAPQRRGGALC